MIKTVGEIWCPDLDPDSDENHYEYVQDAMLALVKIIKMSSLKKLIKMIRVGQLMRTKYRICINKDTSYVGKYPHEGIISFVPSMKSKDLLDTIKVIHFTNKDYEAPFDDGAGNQEGLYVRETTLRKFLLGSIVEDTEIESKLSRFSPEIVVDVAKKLLGQSDYCLRSRNCQSFATHCYFGKADSSVVRSAGRLIAFSIFSLAVTILGISEFSSRTPFI